MFFKKDNSVGFDEERIVERLEDINKTQEELIDEVFAQPIKEEDISEDNGFNNIDEKILEDINIVIEERPEETEVEPINWLTSMEEKIALLKNLEKDKVEKKTKQLKIKEKIDVIKEELAELQLTYEKANDELEEIELKWMVEKEALQEIAINS